MAIVARWESQSGKHWVELYGEGDGVYTYAAPSAGGCLGKLPDEPTAITMMIERLPLFQPDANKRPMMRRF